MRHINWKKWTFAFINILNFGCGKSFTEPKQDIEVSVIRKSYGEYSVHFNFKDDSSYIVRRTRGGEEKSLKELAVSKTAPSDESVVTGATYSYSIGSYVEGNFKNIITKKIRIPYEADSYKEDAVPQDFYRETKNSEGGSQLVIDSLIIRRSKPFHLNLQRGTVLIRNLISEDGQLWTSSPSHSAIYSTEKTQEGELNIEVIGGTGDVNLHLRGENGAQPPPPQALGEEGRGNQGTKGTPGKEVHEFNYQIGDKIPVCHTLIGKGGDGGKGAKGSSGFKGMDGASSPFTKIKFNNSSQIRFSVSREGGQGSAGGLGGQGGPGGFPGPPGDVEKIHITTGDPDKGVRNSHKVDLLGGCPLPPPASFGPEGDTGDQGPNGQDGGINEYCIYSNALNSWECYQ